MTDSETTEETHPLVLPDVQIAMPAGEVPVVRPGTVGGIPAYEADPPKALTKILKTVIPPLSDLINIKVAIPKFATKQKGRKR